MDINIWHECMTEYYTAIIVNEILSFTVMWMMEHTVQRIIVYIILKCRSYRKENVFQSLSWVSTSSLRVAGPKNILTISMNRHYGAPEITIFRGQERRTRNYRPTWSN